MKNIIKHGIYFLIGVFLTIYSNNRSWEKGFYQFVKPVAEKSVSGGKYNRTEFYVEFIDMKTNEHIVKPCGYDCYFNGRVGDTYSYREQSEYFNYFVPIFLLGIAISLISFAFLLVDISILLP